MASLKNEVQKIFDEAFKRLGFDLQYTIIVKSNRPDLGHFQCNGALPLGKQLGKNPREVAEQIKAEVAGNPAFGDISVAGPGFINITLKDSFLAEYANEMAGDERLLVEKTPCPERLIVDYGGPNVAKPMHVGHLRASIIGESLKRLFLFLGHDVTGDIHMGDIGLQMGMLIMELQKRQPDLPYFDENFDGDYPATPPVDIFGLEEMYVEASNRCKEDEAELAKAQLATFELQKGRRGYRALWLHFMDLSLEEMKKDFELLGVSFDQWFGESRYLPRLPGLVERLKKSGYAVESEGALVIHVADDGANKDLPPVILVKSDGGYLYDTTDLATIDERVLDFQTQRMLYVVDKRQATHFQKVFTAAKISGVAGSAEMEHIAFGTVNSPDGKPFKTRAGGTMKLRTLIEMAQEEALKRMEESGIAQDYPEEEKRDIADKVGLAALKYADLMNNRTANYIFDLEKFTRFEGQTGPYLLYAAVRIKSILRKAEAESLVPGPVMITNEHERNLALMLGQLPDTFDMAAEKRFPHFLCDYAFELSQVFSRFYQNCHIMREEDAALQSSRLTLAILCLKVLELVLDILVIDIPDRM